MSTKYLARTAIEGGRRKSYRSDEREWTRSARFAWNQYCNRLRFDPELAYEDEPDDRQIHYESGFADKLSPVMRWLDSRSGRPWAEVRREIKENFDIRTTAGRHIVYCHLLREIRGAGTEELWPDRGLDDYWIDEDGILQGKYRWYRRTKKRNPIRRKRVRRRKWSAEQIWHFFRGRQIIQIQDVWHWQDPYWDATLDIKWAPCIGGCEYPDAPHRKRIVERSSTVYPPPRHWRERHEVRMGRQPKYLGAGVKTWQKPYELKEHQLPSYKTGEPLGAIELRKLETLPYHQQLLYVGYKWNRWT